MELSAAAQGTLPAPRESVRAVVVVPAHNEELRIGRCLEALVGQVEVAPEDFEVIVVLDACDDGTAAVVEARRGGARASTPSSGPARAPGRPARPAWTSAARGSNRSAGATACSPAPTPTRWSRRTGSRASSRRSRPAPRRSAARSTSTRPKRRRCRRRSSPAARPTSPPAPARPPPAAPPSTPTSPAPASASPRGPTATPAAWPGWRRSRTRSWRTGWPPRGSRSTACARSRVVTAARTEGRAERGLARDLELARWLAERRYDGRDFSLDELLAAKTTTVAAILPARECAATIGPILDAIAPLRAAGLLDELLVVDADSPDGTAAVAREHGARVVSESAIRPELGPARGKGDAMWRAAGATSAELLVFLDADTVDFDPGFVTGLLGPMLLDPSLALVKGTFRRPLALGDAIQEGEGGRVTELVARPLLNLHFPRAGRLHPAAGRGDRDPPRPLRAPLGPGRLRGRDRDADRRARPRRARRPRRGRPRRPPEPPPEPARAERDGGRGDGRGRAPHRGPAAPAYPRLPPPPGADGPPELWRLRCEERPPLRDAD